MILSRNAHKGKVVKNIILNHEKVVLPTDNLFLLEGGKQIDPYLLVAAEKQELQKKIAELLEREKKLKEEIKNLKSQLEEERKLVEKERKLIMDEAAKEAQKMKKEQMEEGFQKGYQEGIKKAYKEIEECLTEKYKKEFQMIGKALEEAAKALEEGLERELEKSLPIMVELWKIVLSRLLRKEIEMDDQVAVRIFREIMTKVSNGKKIRLLVNPADRDAFLKKSEEMAEIKRVVDEFELVSDDAVEKGSCIVETNMGVYDARWKVQLEAIEREVDRLMGEEVRVF